MANTATTTIGMDADERLEAQRMAAEQIADHLCAVWGWLPDEAEAHVLAEQLAASVFSATAGTYTDPLSLLQTLLTPRPSAFRDGSETLVIREA